jgi:hypothetical protein
VSCNKALLIFIALAAGGIAAPAPADDACVDFKWDVSKERVLYTGTPVALTAGKDPKSAPVVVSNHLYELRLMSQDHVTFAVPPTKTTRGATAYGGVAILKIQVPGSYRVAIDVPLWIDVVSNGTRVAAEDFQAQHGCSPPHKIVEFNLVGGGPFVLQLSNAENDNALLTVTPSPRRKL